MVTIVGFEVPDASPLQLENAYPEFAAAVRNNCVPAVYVVWSGLLITDPAPVGLTLVASV